VTLLLEVARGQYHIVEGRDHVKLFFNAAGCLTSTCIGRANTIEEAKLLAEQHAEGVKQ
jgi:hypothetical protein